MQYFQPALSYYLSLKRLFCLFLSGRFSKLSLYIAKNVDHDCMLSSEASWSESTVIWEKEYIWLKKRNNNIFWKAYDIYMYLLNDVSQYSNVLKLWKYNTFSFCSQIKCWSSGLNSQNISENSNQGRPWSDFWSSDSCTILGLWVLGLAVSFTNESNYKLMSPEHHFSWQVCNTIASWNSLK